jgi:hypothetical protein
MRFGRLAAGPGAVLMACLTLCATQNRRAQISVSGVADEEIYSDEGAFEVEAGWTYTA